MNATYFKQTSLVVMMTSILSACSAFSNLDQVIPDNTQEYRRAETMPPLDVPPELSIDRINDDIVGDKNTTATYSEFEEASNNPLAARYNIQPDKKPSLAGDGATRHLLVPGDRNVTWQRIQDFWRTRGLTIKRIDSRIGLMDTSADADAYAYRIRLERGDTSKQSNVYLSAVDQSRNNVQKNEAALRQLADYLGILYQQDMQQIQTDQPALAPEDVVRVSLIDEESGQQSLFIEQDYQATWRLVGRVLDSKGFSVEERNQGQGYYLVRYIDPYKEIKPEEKGFFSRLAFWRDDVEEKPQEYFYIKLISEASDTRLMILDAEQKRTSSDTAKRLITLIQEQLVL